MMNELQIFKDKAISHGICKDYLSEWNKARDKKTMIDIALSSEGCDFMCSSINEGWGVDKRWFKREFGSFLNGRYKRNDKTYTSSIYIDYKGAILADTTLMQLIDCDMMIDIPQPMITKIFVCGKSNIELKGKGRVIVAIYGDNVKIDSKRFLGNIKTIKAEKWIGNL